MDKISMMDAFEEQLEAMYWPGAQDIIEDMKFAGFKEDALHAQEALNRAKADEEQRSEDAQTLNSITINHRKLI